MEAARTTLSARGRGFFSLTNWLAVGMDRAAANAFDATTNPAGIINLGTAENKLMMTELLSKFNTPGVGDVHPIDVQYGAMQGQVRLRKAIAGFLTEQTRAPTPLDPETICVLNGAGTVIDTLVQVLCDPGDGMLIPTPFYGGFETDLERRAGARCWNVPSTAASNFQVTRADFEHALAAATHAGVRIRGVVISNPNNPLGICYTAAQLQEMMDFAFDHGLHFIADEIYLASDYSAELLGGPPRYVSALTLKIRKPHLFHFVWAFSKDFGVSGLRTGVYMSPNPASVAALQQLAYFTCVPGNTQHLLANVLEDKPWVARYLKTNHERLAAAYRYLQTGLARLGVPCLPAYAGFFVWADFRAFLPAPTAEHERRLFEDLIDAGVYMALGEAFRCSEPGWFRIITASEPAVMDLVLARLATVLAKRRPIASRL